MQVFEKEKMEEVRKLVNYNDFKKFSRNSPDFLLFVIFWADSK